MIGTTLGDSPQPLSILYYGSPGTAKTTSALGLARLGKVLLIDAEGGANAKALTSQNVPISQIDSWPASPRELSFEAIMGVAKQLQSSNEYTAVVVDSLTEIARRLLDVQVAKTSRTGESGTQPTMQDYGVVASQLRVVFRRFRDSGLHVAFTALQRRTEDENTGAASYGPALSASVANDVLGLVDIVLYTDVIEIGGQVFRVGGSVPLKLRTAKDRTGALPPRLVSPSGDRVLGYVNGELARESDPVQLAALAAASKVAEAIAETTDQQTE